MKLPFIALLILFLFGAGLHNACQRDPYREGARLYKVHCANCHGENGQGLGELIPPLAGADYLKNNRERLGCILSQGLKDTIVVNGKVYAGQEMPANPTLSEFHIANLLNYINSSWGNQNGDFRIEEVRSGLSYCKPGF